MNDFEAEADVHYQHKAEEYAAILEWTSRPVLFTPQGNKRRMHEGGDGEYVGITSDEKWCVHTPRAMYEQNSSPFKDDPDFWKAHEQEGNPFVLSHEAERWEDGTLLDDTW